MKVLKSFSKFALQAIGRVTWLRDLWLAGARWVLCNVALPRRWRNFVLWEMATYVLGDEYVETVNLFTGLRLTVGIDDNVSRSLLLCSPWRDYIWEPQTLRLALKIQPDSKITVVAGGHIGYDALHLAHALQRSGGRVIAFEPFSKSNQRFLQNQYASMIQNVTLERMALSDHSQSEVTLYMAGPGSSIDVTVGADREIVPAVSLDEYVKKQDLDSVGLIFLDVEGSELKVLSGARSLLTSCPAIILEINRPNIRHLGFTPDDVYQFLFARNYSLYFIEDDYFFDLRDYYHAEVVLHPLWGDDPNFQSRLTIFNILAVRDPQILQQPGVKIMVHQPIGRKGTQ
ncbi:MAG: FkbM family methyltransferase [Chloroflexi bacterium]|nr:FkbM family methyltransferase [Chloroflexota bacterium]